MKRHSKKRFFAAAGFSVPALLIAVVLVISALSMSVFRVVSVDGEEIFAVRSRNEAETAISEAEETASRMLGEDFTFGDRLKISAKLRITGARAAHDSETLLNHVGGIAVLPTVTVRGNVAAAVRESGELEKALTILKDRYSGKDTVLCEIEDSASVAEQYVRTDLMMTAEELAALLDPAEGGKFSLSVRTIEKTTYAEEIPFISETTEDGELYENEQEIRTEGQNGSKEVTEYTVRLNGTVTSTERREEILAEPVNELIAVGTKPGRRTDSTGSYQWPAYGEITSYFGYRDYYIGSSNHKGIDIVGDYGQEIYASDGGEVICAEYVTGYGNLIQICHDNGDWTCYAHLSDYAVSVGESVYQGQVIGYMGQTGDAGAVHVHFEIRKGGEKVDPMAYLSEY